MVCFKVSELDEEEFLILTPFKKLYPGLESTEDEIERSLDDV